MTFAHHKFNNFTILNKTVFGTHNILEILHDPLDLDHFLEGLWYTFTQFLELINAEIHHQHQDGWLDDLGV